MTLRKNLVVFFTLLISLTVFAQKNLVPNPSFEDFVKCPQTYSTDPVQFGPKFWNSPSIGTPDYYNKCSVGDMAVPRNWAGVSYPHEGVGYAGIYLWNSSNRSYREYLQCKLIEPLTAETFYEIRFYYRLSLYSMYAVDRIGLALSRQEIKVSHDTTLAVKPILESINELDRLTNAWYKGSTTFRAHGGEQFLIIGNFSSNDSTENVRIETRQGRSPMLAESAYFYIDDVAVIAITSPPAASGDTLSIAVNNVKVNETYTLKHIRFSFDSFELLPESYAELDRLILVLRKHPVWKVELSGHTDDRGSDVYNLRLSQSRVMSVGEYLVRNGIENNRIFTKGFGKQRPLQPGIDENARAANRRVEAKFLE